MVEYEDPWDWLESRLQRFLDAWDARTPGGEAPLIEDHFAAPPGGKLTDDEVEAIGRTLLVELTKADIEYRLLADESRELESYLERFPQLSPLDADLLHHDYRLRLQHGQDIAVDDYCERFPAVAETLRRLLGLDLPDSTLTLYAKHRLPTFELGDLVFDEFRLTSLLGEGSFAKVYLAQQQSLGRMVALKISAIQGNEAQTLVQLDHQNIVRVHDQRDVPDQGMRLIYMEYAPGGTLHDVVKSVDSSSPDRTGQLLTASVTTALSRGGMEATFPSTLRDLPWSHVVCDLGLQLAGALHYAHEKGVLHRDIKPANVLLGANARPKLADFNVSFNSQLQGAAPAAYFGGSLAYMSPEQLRACSLTHADEADDMGVPSDLYSLAVLLWELLHGSRPFHDPHPTGDWKSMLDKMLSRRMAGTPKGSWGKDLVSRDLQAVLSDCLHPTASRRPQSGAQLARELKLCLNPHARALVSPQRSFLGRLTIRHPMLVLLLTLLLPNLFAALLNLMFNLSWINLYASFAKSTFLNVQAIINAIAFPVGIFAITREFWPIADAARRSANGEKIDPSRLTELRRRSLKVGSFGAWVGVALWSVAGLAYPIAIHSMEGDFPWDGYLLFIGDLVVCGLIAGSYPFFLATLVTVETLYPAMLDRDNIPIDEADYLENLAQNTGFFLLIAAGVPMVALLILVPLVIGGQPIYQTALLGLIIAGITGLFGAWRARQKLQKDLQALCYAVSPLTPN